MPMYDVKCKVCNKPGTTRLTFAEYDEVKAGKAAIDCGDESCEGQVEIVFNPGDVAFVLKDGESGGWVSKAGKENAYREKHNKVVSRRQRDHAPRTQLQPNYNGQLTGSWKGAKDAAYQATYEKVREEHGPQVATQAAGESAKTYDPLVNREVTGS